jgi:hypothetical protein
VEDWDWDWEKEDFRERRISVFEDLEPLRLLMGSLVVVVVFVVMFVVCVAGGKWFRDMTSIGRDNLTEAIGGGRR